MKSDWANLPQEIILHIFQYLSQDILQYQKQLQYLQFINRNWGRAARTLYYETISLYGSKKQVDILLQTLESPKNKLLSQAVRKISLGANAFPDEQHLRTLLKMCLNATSITTRPYNCNKLSYYYPLLSELRKEGYLQRLKHVDPPSTTDYISDESLNTKYQDAMLSLAATVTELRIGGTYESASSSRTERFHTVANHLADFVSLKQLEMHVPDKVPLNQVDNLFVDNQPPQLNSLDLSLHSGMPSETYPANDICELSQVEQMTLQVAAMSAQDLGFVMRMFPNLKKLLIESFEETPYFLRVNDSTSTLTFKRFSEYISRIPELDIPSLLMSPEVLLESLASLAEFNKLTVVRVRLTFVGVVHEVDLKVIRRKNEAYACGDQDKTPCQVEMDIEFEATYHLRLMMALLACTPIDYLSIGAEENMLDYAGAAVEYGACLDYILSHCATPAILYLEGLDIDFSSSDATISPLDKRDFSHLALQKCQVSLDTYRYMSQRIGKVGVFTVVESAYDGEGGSRFEAVQIDMPYTVFDTFVYDTEWHDFVVKICVCTKTVILRVSKKNKTQRLKDSMTVVYISAILRQAHETFTP